MISAQHELARIVPHPRTLRKAREKVKWMVVDGVSHLHIRSYLHRYVRWWTNTSGLWTYQEILKWFLDQCWDEKLAAYAAILLLSSQIKKSRTEMVAQPARHTLLCAGLAA